MLFTFFGVLRAFVAEFIQLIIPHQQMVDEVHRTAGGNRIIRRRIGVAYAADPRLAANLLWHQLQTLAPVATPPAPQVGLAAFQATAIALSYR